MRLYGDYARSRTPSSEASDSWKLGFEYRLTGERQRLRQASKEGEGGIFDPIRERPALSVGIVALAALILTDESGGGGGGGGDDKQVIKPKETPRGGTPASTGTRNPDGTIDRSPLPANGIEPKRGAVATTDPVFGITTVELPSIPRDVDYLVDTMGSTTGPERYEVHSLYVTQDGNRRRMATTDRFVLKQGGEAKLETYVAIKAVPRATVTDPSMINVRMVPAAPETPSDYGTTLAVTPLKFDPQTGVITVEIPVAGTNALDNNGVVTATYEVGERSVAFSLAPVAYKQRSGEASATVIGDNDITVAIFGEGEDGAETDDASVVLEVGAELLDLGADKKRGGGDDTGVTFPAEGVGPVRAVLQFVNSAGARAGSYEVVSGATLVSAEQGLYEVTLESYTHDSGTPDNPADDVINYTADVEIMGKDVRIDGETVAIELFPRPVSITTDETTEQLPTLFAYDTTGTVERSDVTLTLDSKKSTRATVGEITFDYDPGNPSDSANPETGALPNISTGSGYPFVEPESEPLEIDLALLVEFPTAIASQSDITVPLEVKKIPIQRGVAEEGVDFEIDQASLVTESVPSGGVLTTPDTLHNLFVKIKILPDDDTEPEEKFTLVLGDFGDQNLVATYESLAEIEFKIAANVEAGDTAAQTFKGITVTPTIAEPSSGTADVTVTVTMADTGDAVAAGSELQIPIVINARSDDANSADFGDPSVASGVLLFAGDDSDTADDTASLTIPINADNLAEGTETLTVRAVLPDNVYVANEGVSLTSRTVITDDDLPFFRLSVPNELEENRDDPSLNVLRISSHSATGAGINDATKQLALERSLTFFIDAGNSANTFNTNDRVKPETFPRTVTIPAGQYYADFPVQIENNELVDAAAKTFELKRIVADSKGVLPSLLAKAPANRGLGVNGVKKGVTEIAIVDDDRVKLQLYRRVSDGNGGFTQGELLGDDAEVTLSEEGTISFFLTVDKNFEGVNKGAPSERRKNTARVRITLAGLGSANNNDVEAHILDATGADLPTAIVFNADGTKPSQIPLTNAVPLPDGSGLTPKNEETDRRVIELRSTDESFGDAQRPINIRVKFHGESNADVFDTRTKEEIDQDVEYISNDLSIALVGDDSITLTEGQDLQFQVELRKEGRRATTEDVVTALGSDTGMSFAAFWVDSTATSGGAKALLDATDYQTTVLAAITANGNPDYPTVSANYGYEVAGFIPEGQAVSDTVTLPVGGNYALDGLDNVVIRIFADDSIAGLADRKTTQNPTGTNSGYFDEKDGLTIANAEGAEISWQDTNRRATGTEGTAETLNAKIRLIDPEGTVTGVAPDLTDTGDIEVVLETPAPITQGVDESDPVNSLAVAAGYDFDNDASTSGTGKTPKTLTFTGATGAATVAVTYDDDYITREDTQSRFNLVLRDVAEHGSSCHD